MGQFFSYTLNIDCVFIPGFFERVDKTMPIGVCELLLNDVVLIARKGRPFPCSCPTGLDSSSTCQILNCSIILSNYSLS